MGAVLDERELALTLAAIGVTYLRRDLDGGLAPLLQAKDSGFTQRATAEHGIVLEAPVRLRSLQAYIRDSRKWQADRGAPMPWQDFQSRWKRLVPPETRVRFRVDVGGSSADPDIDLGWLTRLLGTPSLDAYGVYVALPPAPLSLSWEWPLRIGVPRAPWSAPFRDALEGGRFRQLYELPDVDAKDSACDLLLMPASLRDAAQAAQALDVRASATIVVGGTTDSAQQTLAMLDGMCKRLRIGAIAIAHVPAIERVFWFNALLAEIAHNATLDMALTRTSRAQTRNHFRGAADEGFAGDLTPPLVFADRAFVDRAVMDELARRIGTAASTLPQAGMPAGLEHSFSGLTISGADATVKTIGDQLASSAEKVAWHHETGDATVLASFRQRVEGITGAALTLPPLVIDSPSRSERGIPGGWTTAPPGPVPPRPPTPQMRGGQRAKPPVAAAAAPQPESARQQDRSVLANIFEQSQDNKWTSTGGTVAAGATCALDIFVGVPREGVVSAQEPLNEKSLPPSATGHELTIAFTPLWRGSDDAFAPAQAQHVHLPPAPVDSSHAMFYFRAPASLASMRARVVVLFGFRVLQTLILDAPGAGSDAKRRFRLEVENRVSHDFGERTEAPPFDAALIVNDNPAGIPGITALATDGATFIEPEGLPKLIDNIRKQLKVLNLDDAAPDLDAAAIDSLLLGLATHGAMLTKLVKAQPQMTALLGARRLQVVDARQGAYLPIEFFYDGKAPLPEAKRCEHAVAALANLDVHANCPNNKDANFYCPAAFWGFSRCLERQPFGGLGVTVFRQPQPGSNTLRPLEKALLAASERVRPEDLDPPNGIETVLTDAAGAVARASSWQDWQSKVTSESPSLLVLLPHSLDSPTVAGMPALEISGTKLAAANVERELVTANAERTPVMLLLGCSTALPDVPFLNFVGQFKDNGAALVIGTIATIRGRQVGAFVRTLLAELHNAAAGGSGTFDEVFLRVKQRLLAAGDPFVLSLMAYGDTGWRIQA